MVPAHTASQPASRGTESRGPGCGGAIPHAPALVGSLGGLLAVPAHDRVPELCVGKLAAVALAKYASGLLRDLGAQGQRRRAGGAGRTGQGRLSRRRAEHAARPQAARLGGGAGKRRGRVRQDQRRSQRETRHHCGRQRGRGGGGQVVRISQQALPASAGEEYRPAPASNAAGDERKASHPSRLPRARQAQDTRGGRRHRRKRDRHPRAWLRALARTHAAMRAAAVAHRPPSLGTATSLEVLEAER